MRRTSLFAAVAAVAAMAGLACPSLVGASPPSGQFSFRDIVRAEITAPGTFAPAPGSGISTSGYTLAPGAATGWRDLPGPSVLAVVRGTLAVHTADGCASREYAAGQAAVLPAGPHAVAATGDGPAEFSGTFLAVPVDAPMPLTGGDPVPAPAGCALAAGPAGPLATLADVGRSAFGADAYGAGGHGGHGGVGTSATPTIDAEPGKDALVSFYRFEPGFSAGWHSHNNPYLAVITKGALEYYDGHDGQCRLQGRYEAGDAYMVVPGPGHKHLAGNYDDEPAEGYAIYLNVKRTYPVPVFGNQLDANDFSPTPSPDCPRLRDPNL